jgi:hypothetical protein
LVVLALVAPIPFALLWGQQFRAGLVAGYAFWLVILGSVPAWLAYQGYRAIEYIARFVLRPRFRDAAAPPPPAFSKRRAGTAFARHLVARVNARRFR